MQDLAQKFGAENLSSWFVNFDRVLVVMVFNISENLLNYKPPHVAQ